MSEFESLTRQILNCTLCALSRERTQAVPGEGSTSSDVVFIGEGPGFYEDRDGRPFVGSAGMLLEKLLTSIGLNRSDVYITNMVKCRPPNNRDPFPDELQACKPYLMKQLELINPKVVVTLGRHSFWSFFPGQTISKARGKPRKWNGFLVYPMYHPAAALHNPALRPVIEDDFKRLPSLINQATGSNKVEMKEKSQQLGLFSSTE